MRILIAMAVLALAGCQGGNSGGGAPVSAPPTTELPVIVAPASIPAGVHTYTGAHENTEFTLKANFATLFGSVKAFTPGLLENCNGQCVPHKTDRGVFHIEDDAFEGVSTGGVDFGGEFVNSREAVNFYWEWDNATLTKEKTNETDIR